MCLNFEKAEFELLIEISLEVNTRCPIIKIFHTDLFYIIFKGMEFVDKEITRPRKQNMIAEHYNCDI